jgi:aminoglycoside phosphotransferase family enzyme
MTIIEALLEGKIAGSDGAKPHHIVTAISNIFVFPSIVYKIYKNDSEFFNKNFNDLSQKDNRFLFTRKDFDWNNQISPEIYTDLKGIRLENDEVFFVEPNANADELMIVMNKIDMANQVIRKLVDNKITIKDCYEIGKQLGERVSKLQVPVLNFTAYDDFQSRYKDEVAWITSVKEIPKNEAEKYLSFVKEFIESHREELDKDGQMGYCLDVHADNAIYTDGEYLPIDTYAPKEAWLYGFKNINIYRVATDFYVFMGKKAFDEVIRGYEESTKQRLLRDWDKFMVIYCEIIMWPYQYMLAEKEPWRLEIAKKHQEFIESIFSGQ